MNLVQRKFDSNEEDSYVDILIIDSFRWNELHNAFSLNSSNTNVGCGFSFIAQHSFFCKHIFPMECIRDYSA